MTRSVNVRGGVDIPYPAERDRPAVLVVDDLQINRMLLCRMLKMQNLVVWEATNGVEALKLYSNIQNLSMVFLDLIMPQLDGLATAACMRSLDRPRIPIIAYTAEEHMRSACERAGMDDYVLKPVCLDQIRTLVSRYVYPCSPDPPPSAPQPDLEQPPAYLVRERLSMASAANVLQQQHHELAMVSRQLSEQCLHSQLVVQSAPNRVSLDERLPGGAGLWQL